MTKLYVIQFLISNYYIGKYQNNIFFPLFQADLKQRAHGNNKVRRTHSDLGGQRLFNWEQPKFYRRMISSPAPIRSRPQSPKKKPPCAPGDVVLRPSTAIYRRSGQLRRSLSQPLDIDKLSPLMRVKTAGKYNKKYKN